MNNRERAMAVLHYQDCDRMPLVHFGWWEETLEKWAAEGHVTTDEARGWADGNDVDRSITARLGFDFNWGTAFGPATHLHPPFEEKVVEEFPDGSRHLLNGYGMIVLERPGAVGIPAEVGHTLKDRASWEEHFKWRWQFSPERVTEALVRAGDLELRWDEGGLEFLRSGPRDYLYGLSCGSLYGQIRNATGMAGSAYMQVDDPELFAEIIDTVGEMTFQVVRYVLEAGARFDFGHMWEDICFRSGPIINPRVFRERVGPHYRRITALLADYGIDIVSLDCDGKIDDLVPIWLENGVNTMFPIEVGVWGGSIGPWRQEYGRQVRGVGGVNKHVLARDRAAVDAEIERIKPLVDLGGYIPCPDHRIAPDGQWDLVRYYCERMREVF